MTGRFLSMCWRPSPGSTDVQLLELWLHGRSPHTQRAYRTDIGHFIAFVSKPLRTVTVAEQPPVRRRTPVQEIRVRRNYVLLRLLYTAGLRVDEIARLAWRDLRERGDARSLCSRPQPRPPRTS